MNVGSWIVSPPVRSRTGVVPFKFQSSCLPYIIFPAKVQLVENHVKNGRLNEALQANAFSAVAESLGHCLQDWSGEKEALIVTKNVCKRLKKIVLDDVDAKVAVCRDLIPKLIVGLESIRRLKS